MLVALTGVALADVGVMVLVWAIGDRNEDGTAVVGVVALVLCLVCVVSGVSLLRGGRFGGSTTPGNQHQSSDISFLGGD